MIAKVILDLAKVDGNAFAIMGAWKQAAKRQGWSATDITAVLEQCIQSDYDNLLRIIIANSRQQEEN